MRTIASVMTSIYVSLTHLLVVSQVVSLYGNISLTPGPNQMYTVFAPNDNAFDVIYDTLVAAGLLSDSSSFPPNERSLIGECFRLTSAA
jgi:hypothetical protein